MAKAVLIMDMPDDCMGCQLVDSEDEICLGVVTNDMLASEVGKYYCGDYYTHGKPEWCPLIPEPERMSKFEREQGTLNDRDYEIGRAYVIGMTDGWNVCIDVLEGNDET